MKEERPTFQLEVNGNKGAVFSPSQVHGSPAAFPAGPLVANTRPKGSSSPDLEMLGHISVR